MAFTSVSTTAGAVPTSASVSDPIGTGVIVDSRDLDWNTVTSLYDDIFQNPSALRGALSITQYKTQQKKVSERLTLYGTNVLRLALPDLFFRAASDRSYVFQYGNSDDGEGEEAPPLPTGDAHATAHTVVGSPPGSKTSYVMQAFLPGVPPMADRLVEKPARAVTDFEQSVKQTYNALYNLRTVVAELVQNYRGWNNARHGVTYGGLLRTTWHAPVVRISIQRVSGVPGLLDLDVYDMREGPPVSMSYVRDVALGVRPGAGHKMAKVFSLEAFKKLATDAAYVVVDASRFVQVLQVVHHPLTALAIYVKAAQGIVGPDSRYGAAMGSLLLPTDPYFIPAGTYEGMADALESDPVVSATASGAVPVRQASIGGASLKPPPSIIPLGNVRAPVYTVDEEAADDIQDHFTTDEDGLQKDIRAAYQHAGAKRVATGEPPSNLSVRRRPRT